MTDFEKALIKVELQEKKVYETFEAFRAEREKLVAELRDIFNGVYSEGTIYANSQIRSIIGDNAYSVNCRLSYLEDECDWTDPDCMERSPGSGNKDVTNIIEHLEVLEKITK